MLPRRFGVGCTSMTGFGDASEKRSAAERRQQRMAEARRRVESGENTAPPPAAPAPTPASRPRAARSPGAGAVNPTAAPGSTYAVWRSVQHFCTTDSLPDARSGDLDLLVAWSDTLQPFRLRQRVVARLDSHGTWSPVCYAKDGRREPISQAQADKYREARLGDSTMSGGAVRPLDDSAHPEVTEEL